MKLRGIFCLLGALLSTGATLQAQQWDWVQRFSGDGTVGTAVGVDDAQNVYVAGTFAGTNYIGTNRITSDTGHNLFFAKFDAFGVPLWTVTATGALTKMLVASNGSVFVCGALSFNNPADEQSTRIFLARLDEGSVTWAEPLPEGVVPGGLAFGPDETLYVLGVSEQPFMRRYKQGGGFLDAATIQLGSFAPIGISITQNGEIYVAGRYRPNTWPDNYPKNLIAQISSSGQSTWVQEISAGYYAREGQINAIAATPDDGVISVGVGSTPLPARWAFMVKRSTTGAEEWSTGLSGYFKTFYSAEAVTLDRRGNIYITGYADGTYYNRERLLVLTLSPNGEHLSDERIASYAKSHANNGKAIAVDKDGAVIVTGTLEGQTIFGTNRLSYALRNGFVVRRSTIFPELAQQQVGNEIVLSWPTTGFPFALQESNDGTNWSFVTVPPQRIGLRNQTTLPTSPATTFRLFRTNEAPILHLPRLWVFAGISFLAHEKVVILGSSNARVSRIDLEISDEDDDPLTVTWTNLQTGQPLTNNISIERYPGMDYWDMHYGPYYRASVALDAASFPPGKCSVSVSVSDGIFTVTQDYPEFEVIGFEMAFAEFTSALESLRSDRAGRRAVLSWESYRRARDKGREKLADKRWRHFQHYLQRVTSLSEEERGKLASAAEQVKSLL